MIDDFGHDPELRAAVLEASLRDEVCAEVGRVYDELALQISRRRPVCDASGRCCHFEEYGHRLYVSTMELARFVRDRREARPVETVEVKATLLPVLQSVPGCPFQRERLCSVHAIRPLGCRIFFCDPTSTAWQQEMYERLHGRLRQSHETLGVPYRYVEWRFALRALGPLEERVVEKPAR